MYSETKNNTVTGTFRVARGNNEMTAILIVEDEEQVRLRREYLLSDPKQTFVSQSARPFQPEQQQRALLAFFEIDFQFPSSELIRSNRSR